MTLLNSILAATAPYLVEIVITLATIATGIIVQKVNAVLGNVVTAQNRTRLHEAVVNGVQAAITQGLSGTAIEAVAVEYAKAYVPDAVRKLNASDRALRAIARAKTPTAHR